MQQGWRIARIGGVDIRVDPSAILIMVLVGAELWSLFVDPLRFPGGGPGLAVGLTLFGVAAFLGSILLHELAHAATCRLRGIPVLGITLMLFGGATHARLESKGPLDEFLVTLAGPATSLALGGVLLAVSQGPGADAYTNPFLWEVHQLGWLNIALGVFNLLPGFPLDGGRLLKSALWRVLGDSDRATVVAARIGQAFAAVLVVFGLVRGVPHLDLGWLWFAVIGVVLWRAATGAIGDTRRRGRLRGLTAGQVMGSPPPSVPADLPIADATARFLAGHAGESFPVLDQGRLIGFVSEATVRGSPGERPVREALAAPHGVLTAPPSERLDEVLTRLLDSGSSAVLVVDGDRLVGLIEVEDLSRALSGVG